MSLQGDHLSTCLVASACASLSHCCVSVLCTAADGAAFFEHIAQTPPRATPVSPKEAAAGPASPPPLPKEAPVIDGPAGEGEAEIQKMLFVGNYSDAVEACLEVSAAGAGLLRCLRTRILPRLPANTAFVGHYRTLKLTPDSDFLLCLVVLPIVLCRPSGMRTRG